jgi:hypothetical protein
MSLPVVENPLADYEKQLYPLDAKQSFKLGAIEYKRKSESSFDVLDSERDIVTNIICVHDDPNLNPWTLRAFVIGFSLSAFGGVLGKLFGLRFPSAAEIFEQPRFTTSNRYELVLSRACQCQLIL